MVDAGLTEDRPCYHISFGKAVARISTAARTLGGIRGERGHSASQSYRNLGWSSKRQTSAPAREAFVDQPVGEPCESHALRCGIGDRLEIVELQPAGRHDLARRLLVNVLQHKQP